MTGFLDQFLKMETPSKRWLALHLDHQDREFCLMWPFHRAQNGYAQTGTDRVAPHRVMCEYRNGPPPSDCHQAAHSCARGHLGCVNPWHLDWKTPSENECDKYRDGVWKPQRKLTPDQVDEIRSMKGRERTVDTAERFNISERNIRDIQAGKIWRLENSNRHVFTREEVERIKAVPQAHGAVKGLAEEFGVHIVTIQRIRSGDSYKHFSEAAE